MNKHLQVVPSDGRDYDLRTADAGGRHTYGRYVVQGTRHGDAWSLEVSRVLAAADEHEETIVAPDPVRLTDETGGPDPRALLEALLHGPLVTDGSRLAHDLIYDEVQALRDASPALREELIRLLSSPSGDESELGSWLLTAMPHELDELEPQNVPAPYRDLVRRVREEELLAETYRERAARATSADSRAYWRMAAGDIAPDRPLPSLLVAD